MTIKKIIKTLIFACAYAFGFLSLQIANATPGTYQKNNVVIAQAGQKNDKAKVEVLDSRFRGNDGKNEGGNDKENVCDKNSVRKNEEDIQKQPFMITAVGDVQLGRAWPEAKAALPPDGPNTILQFVRELLINDGLTFGNLETALADSGDSNKCRRGSKVCYAFRAPSSYAATLGANGFEVMSNANNHAGDFGEAGRQATREALTKANIVWAAGVDEIASFTHQGRRVVLIAFGYGANMNQVQNIEAAIALVTRARQNHDIVIVSMHVGAEGSRANHVTKKREIFLGEDRGNSYAFAHAVIDAGAHLVIGHGPHVLRAFEIYRGHLIAYSLGNFSAWYSFNLSGPLGISGILQAQLDKDGKLLTAQLLPVSLDGGGIPKPDPQKRAIKIIRQLSQADFGNPVIDENGLFKP
ncbi:MAG: CapA family protein [Deltaproteobacteria bacterium]|nr:CapA family protein [Deltaproteobacteria bacterium]